MRRGFLKSTPNDGGDHDATAPKESHDAMTFDGEWEDDGGMVVEIEGTTMTSSDGVQEITIISRKRCAFKMNSKLYQGTLAANGSKLTWSDGVVWTRKQTFTGCQSSNRNNEEICSQQQLAKLDHGSNEVGIWLRSLDDGSVVEYEPQLCALFNSLSEIKERYSSRPQAFFEDVYVECPAHRMTFARALRRLKNPAQSKFTWQRVNVQPAAAELHEVETSKSSNPDGNEPRLTLEQFLTIQRELHDGFANKEFQQKLKEVEAKHGKAYKHISNEHTQLFLSVQNVVLPKYGFAQGQKGVLQMLKEAAHFNENKQFQQARAVLNQLLGLDAPTNQLDAEKQLDAPLITESLRFQLRQNGAANFGTGALSIMNH